MYYVCFGSDNVCLLIDMPSIMYFTYSNIYYFYCCSFLLDVSSFLLTLFPLCLENYFQPFLYSRSASYKRFSFSLTENVFNLLSSFSFVSWLYWGLNSMPYVLSSSRNQMVYDLSHVPGPF
jgi:hypothetical protein